METNKSQYVEEVRYKENGEKYLVKAKKGYDISKGAFKYPANVDVNKLNIPEGGFFG